jgi:cell division control protein 6
MISFLDLYGLINARVVSMGRYGKTREIAGSLPERVVRGVVKDFVNHNL